MNRRLPDVLRFVFATAGFIYSALSIAQAPIPLPAHSSVDQDQPRPLFSALQNRFASVETDVLLVNNELLIGRSEGEIMAGRTLNNLYLEPLRLIIMRGAGQVYPETTRPLFLFINLLNDPEESYQQLVRTLTPYERYLTRFTSQSTELGAVTIILAANAPRDLINAENERFFALQGELTELLDGSLNPNVTPVVSADWNEFFEWSGSGEISTDERQRLATYNEQARDSQVQLIFRNAPDIPPIWDELRRAGLDLIQTRRAEALADFLNTPP